jgi:hypothetical protein
LIGKGDWLVLYIAGWLVLYIAGWLVLYIAGWLVLYIAGCSESQTKHTIKRGGQKSILLDFMERTVTSEP